jgi:hypothetical protein
MVRAEECLLEEIQELVGEAGIQPKQTGTLSLIHDDEDEYHDDSSD